MASRLDAILVVDVEATCWQGPPPPGEKAEIIEVGLCLLDLVTLERRDPRSILVRPEQSRVGPFCTELTSLTAADVEAGVSFAAACSTLAHEHDARERTWASWGDFDRRQFERQCHDRGVPYPFGPSHLNVKNLLAAALGWPAEVGMAIALERLGMPLEGRHHRGIDDALNVAALLGRTLRAVRGYS